MAKLSPGIKAFRANIRAMKKVGRDAERQREREAKANHRAHLKVMADRAAGAEAEKAARAADGVARRDAHNARLAAEKAEREARKNAIKLKAA